MSSFHNPVMLNEVISYLNVQQGQWYIDCNLGGGGHTEGILKMGGKVLGIDLDPDAISEVCNNHKIAARRTGDCLQAFSENLILIQANFSKIKEISTKFLHQPIFGILFDLGVSSYQLETPLRGFSFNVDAPLDMRMNHKIGITAADLLNVLPEKELARMFWEYGEENFSRPIAKKIVEYRKHKKIEATNELANIILSVRHRTASDRTHPATRIFQALRIAVNDELTSLEDALPQSIEVLQPGGRLVVISFHSLEDRIVKNFMNREEERQSLTMITQKPVVPTKEEININHRSRSAKLRVAEKP